MAVAYKGPQLNRITITINGEAWTWNANTGKWISPIPQAELTPSRMADLVRKFAGKESLP